MVKGVSAKGWVDGRELDDSALDGVFAVNGTETYDTTNGTTNTVPLLERVDLSKHADKFTRRHESRTWTAQNGKATEAMYVRYERGQVTLMNKAGKSTGVALAALSDADRDYVREKIAELKPPKRGKRAGAGG